MNKSFKEFLKEATEQEAITLSDVFEINKNNVIIAYKKGQEKQATAFAPKFKKDEKDRWEYVGKNTYLVANNMQDKIANLVKTYNNKNDNASADNSSKFEKLGESVAYDQVFNVMYTGEDKVKVNAPEKQDENTSKSLKLNRLKEKLDLLWNIKFSDEFIEKGTVEDLITEMAKRKAYADKNDKGKAISYTNEIKTSSAIKNLYNKFYNAYRNAFTKGLNDGGEKIKKGGRIIDPITNKPYEVDEQKLSWARNKLAGVAEEATEIAKDLAGLNNKDILSRALNGLISGKKLSEFLTSKKKIVIKVPDETKNAAYEELSEIAHLHEYIGKSNFESCLKKTKKTVKLAADLFKKVEDKNFKKMQAALGELSKTSLGRSWLHKFAIIKNESFNTYLDSKLMLDLLNEANENLDKNIKNICNMVDTLLKTDTPDKFTAEYSKFEKAVQIFENITSEEVDDETDLYFRFCRQANAILMKSKNPEKENEKSLNNEL